MPIRYDAKTVVVTVTPAGEVSRTDARAALGVSTATLQNYEQKGRLTRVKRFGQIFYPVDEIKTLAGVA